MVGVEYAVCLTDVEDFLERRRIYISSKSEGAKGTVFTPQQAQTHMRPELIDPTPDM
jgi:hypothetical protein